MSWAVGADNADEWKPDGGGEAWNGGEGAATAENTGADDWGGGNDTAAGASGNDTCRTCGQTGHYARDCPDKPEGGGLTGECYNCGETGHNKADCPNPRVERPFTGNCHSCGEEGHAARDCPTNPMTCKLCGQPGHKALECKERRIVDWSGVPEMDSGAAWSAVIDSAKAQDLDAFRTAIRAYARAVVDDFSLVDVEKALRQDNMPVFLVAKKVEIAPNNTIVDLIGNPEQEFVLSFQKSAKPRRLKLAEGWPETPEENLLRLAKAGIVQDRGVPLCSNCGELGHIKKSCSQEVPEHVSNQPAIQCVYCKETGHRARDCTKERINPYACKNCKQEGHTAKECTEPRSAENVECRKCNEMGHFSKDCPNVEARPPRTCRNCGSEDHIAKECDQPPNMDNVTCNNCEKQGHFFRDCPQPKDWTKVTCKNCGEKGHTIKRCKAPIEGDGMGNGGSVAGGGWDNGKDAGGTGGGESTWATGDTSGW